MGFPFMSGRDVIKWAPEKTTWNQVMNMWLELMGWKIEDAPEFKVFHHEVDLDYSHLVGNELSVDGQMEILRGKYYLVSGDSPRGVKHICIYQDGKLIHDPHPTGEGIINHLWFEKITKIL